MTIREYTGRKTCLICGREFTPDSPNKKYCCLYCREAASRKKRKQWEADHPGYAAEYARRRRNAGQSADQPADQGA